MAPELSRPVPIDRIESHGLSLAVEATEAECAALAARFQIPGIASMRCDWTLAAPQRRVVRASGTLRAVVVQTCVVTLDDFETTVAETFALRFVPAGTETPVVDPEAEDEFPYEGDSLDLGEASAEQLALALDPYPHKPGLAEADLEIDQAAPSHPFAALRGRIAPH